MSSTAFQTQYRQEFIAGFEQRQSLLRQSVTTDAQVNAQSAVFLVADSGGASAVTRGVDGLIPYRNDNLTQSTCTLVEWHDGVRRTGFNLYASQGDGRRIMQQTTMGVLNRKIDLDILAELETGTQDNGAATTASLNMVMYAKAVLGKNAVPMDGNIFSAISPAFEAYLMQVPEFGSADYVNNKPFANSLTMFRWVGVNFIVHPNITGIGTATEKCLMWHRDAIGHACDLDSIRTDADYNREHDYSWALASAFMGSKLLQNGGVFQMKHDGSAYAAQ
jgi:hypothetical protein